jgi:phage host-nuclease inhibitor protein Gam
MPQAGRDKEKRDKEKKAKEGQFVISPPNSLEEVDAYIAEISERQRFLQRIEGNANDAIERIKKNAEDEANPIKKEIEAFVKALHFYCSAKRQEILPPGLKSLKLMHGVIGWRMSPWRVGKITNVIILIKRLRRSRLSRFIRRPPPELDKQALLKERELAYQEGVPFERDELFFVHPAEVREIVVPEKISKPEKTKEQ